VTPAKALGLNVPQTLLAINAVCAAPELELSPCEIAELSVPADEVIE
jgi:hypothetical protein